MKCDQAAEFVSALYDGEIIPRDVAEHIGTCEACRARLQSYIAMGADLRREASVVLADAFPVLTFERRRTGWRDIWQKGWEGMRIPRFVFAGMLAGIVVLGSSLAVVRARVRSAGNVLLLKMTPQGEQPVECALSAAGKKESGCAYVSKSVGFMVTSFSKDGDRATLGIRAEAQPMAGKHYFGTRDFENLPEKTYSFEPGDTLHVNVPGFGELALTGSWIDHIPAMIAEGDSFDPKRNEVRLVSPLLLCNKQVAGDMEGATAIADQLGEYVGIFWPGEGRYDFSLSPMPGAVQGKVKANRVTFAWKGDQYVLVTGVPITRAKELWVRRDAGYKPSGNHLPGGFITASRISDLKTQEN